MKVLVLGGSGMLGTDVVAELSGRGHEVHAPGSRDLDITDPAAVAGLTDRSCRWWINCAAYTAVDNAETETDPAVRLNTLAPGYLARAASMASARFLHVSTDFVFDGTATEPYQEDAPTNPLGAYGRTKREGEEAVMASGADALIVRTAWLYGPNGRCFPKTMIRAWLAGKTLRVVADQVGSPTYTADLARIVVDLLEGGAEKDIYHAAGPDTMTWRDFAELSIETYKRMHALDQPIAIQPIKTEDWPTPATRPQYSVLSTQKLQSLGIRPMRATAEALVEFCERLGPLADV